MFMDRQLSSVDKQLLEDFFKSPEYELFFNLPKLGFSDFKISSDSKDNFQKYLSNSPKPNYVRHKYYRAVDGKLPDLELYLDYYLGNCRPNLVLNSVPYNDLFHYNTPAQIDVDAVIPTLEAYLSSISAGKKFKGLEGK